MCGRAALRGEGYSVRDGTHGKINVTKCEHRAVLPGQALAHRQYLGRRVLGVEPSARGPYVLLRCARSESTPGQETLPMCGRFVYYLWVFRRFTDPNPDPTEFPDTSFHHICEYSCDYPNTHAAWHL